MIDFSRNDHFLLHKQSTPFRPGHLNILVENACLVHFMDILTRENHWECPGSALSPQTRHPYFVKVFLRNFNFWGTKKYFSPRNRNEIFPKIFLRGTFQKVVEVYEVIDACRFSVSSSRYSLVSTRHPP